MWTIRGIKYRTKLGVRRMLGNTIADELTFDNRILRSLPIDENMRSYPRQVSNAIFSYTRPQYVKNPVLVAYSPGALKLLGISCDGIDDLSVQQEKELADFLSGNRLLVGASPHAHCYCGYQFGIFAGQLGDGAAVSLGEVLVNSKEESELSYILRRYELQLKGGGITPFSRK